LKIFVLKIYFYGSPVPYTDLEKQKKNDKIDKHSINWIKVD